MGSIRTFLLNQSDAVVESFTRTVLCKFWNDFHLYVWKNRKNFSSFLGNEITLFVGNSGSIIEFFETSLITTNEITDICMGLRLWTCIFKFLGFTYIVEDEEQEYLNRMEQFQKDVEDFYEVGSRNFLSLNGTTDG